jgi:hypothetical protein
MSSIIIGGISLSKDEDSETLLASVSDMSQEKFEKSLEDLSEWLSVFKIKKIVFQSGDHLGNLVLPDWFIQKCKQAGIQLEVRSSSRDTGMQLISLRSELIANLHTLEEYMQSESEEDRQFHSDLLRNGVCFVAYTHNDRDYFAPSRFIGYKSNNRSTHLGNGTKDGRLTNAAISEILGSKPAPDKNLNASYIKFCKHIDFKALEKGSFGVERKFWRLPP